MRLTKFTHACFRLEADGRALVVDPGAFSEESALDGAEAVLVTHEHPDHLDRDKLRAAAAARPDLTIWTCGAVADQLADLPATVRPVRAGDGFDAAGFHVRVVGEWHAPNHPDQPVVSNVGFLVHDEVFYPGDAFTPPGTDVSTLLVPTGAPWLRLADLIGYLREVRPARAYSTHDGLYGARGLRFVDNWLGAESDHQRAEMRRLDPGESVDL